MLLEGSCHRRPRLNILFDLVVCFDELWDEVDDLVDKVSRDDNDPVEMVAND